MCRLSFKDLLSFDQLARSVLTARSSLMRTSAKLFLPIVVRFLSLAWSILAEKHDDAAVIEKFIAGQAKKEAGSEPDGIRKIEREPRLEERAWRMFSSMN